MRNLSSEICNVTLDLISSSKANMDSPVLRPNRLSGKAIFKRRDVLRLIVGKNQGMDYCLYGHCSAKKDHVFSIFDALLRKKNKQKQEQKTNLCGQILIGSAWNCCIHNLWKS